MEPGNSAQVLPGSTDRWAVEQTTDPAMEQPDESSELLRARSDILGEVAHLQQEYVRNRDVAAMWQLLLDSLLRSSGCDIGFIGELVWTDIGVPNLETRASTLTDVLPPTLGLVISEVIASADHVFVGLPSSDTRFLGLPLVAADRVIGVVGLSGPKEVLSERSSELLLPLVTVVASIIEALNNAAERDAAMERLEKNLSFLQAVVGSASLGVVVIDEVGEVELVNDAVCTRLGRTEKELVGQTLVPIVASADIAWILSQFNGPENQNGTFARRTVGMYADRNMAFSADMTVSTFKLSGGRLRAVLLFRDIEAELLAQATARRSADLLAATPDLVAWTAPDGSIDYLNAGGRSMIREEDINGMRMEDLFPAWAVETFRHEIIEVSMRDGSWMGELALKASDGEEIPVSMTCLFRDQGTDAFFAILARDLREHRHLELLQNAFVSTVSHELRTPLTGILGYLEMFAAGELGEVNVEQKLALDVMRRNGSRLHDLVKKLLQVASIGQTALRKPLPVSIADVVENVVGELGRRHVGELITTIEQPDAAVTGSQSELGTLIGALVENAIKFSPQGGEIEVRLSREFDRVEVEVSDSGMGIPAPEIDQICERFFRASNAREMEVQGAGLGLAIARAIARKHGGEITATSVLNEGTTMRVILPASRSEGGDHDGDGPRG